MSDGLDEAVDTVIIGNGPSALILSYILHGHIPRYIGGHHDALLDRKLTGSSDLLNITSDLFDHFRSSLSYSAQALPINTLLDTLLRPNGDTDLNASSCIEWRYEPQRAVSHVVLGNAPSPGGQWAENPVVASWDIGTLSYAEQLSLPGYTIAEHWRRTKGKELPELVRPTRREVADYFAAYPAAVGIANAVRTSANASSVSRIHDGFHISPHNLSCKHLVLATGVFNVSIPPPPFLRPLLSFNAEEGALLVVGSGFTAADIIISTSPNRKIIHLFNWDPINRPSPLKGCHGSAYPEYAWIYRQMKAAADRGPHPTPPKAEALPFIKMRDWRDTYEGFANARVISTSLDVDEAPENRFFSRRKSSVSNTPPPLPKSMFGRRRGSSIVGNRTPTVQVNIGRSSLGEPLRRTISSLRYAAGRRGSLSYLDDELLREVLPRKMNPRLSMSMAERPLPLHPPKDDLVSTLRRGSIEHDFALEPKLATMITGQTLRGKIEGLEDRDADDDDDESPLAPTFEVAPNVFAIGSLTGDSLVRFAFGGCAAVAGQILNGKDREDNGTATTLANTQPTEHHHDDPSTEPPSPRRPSDIPPTSASAPGNGNGNSNGNGKLVEKQISGRSERRGRHPQNMWE